MMNEGVKVRSSRKSLISWMIRVLIPILIAPFNSFSFTGIKLFYQKKRAFARENEAGLRAAERVNLFSLKSIHPEILKKFMEIS
jgi:hypothetical protein